MSTNNRIRVMIGLSVLGSLAWTFMRQSANADEPRDANPSTGIASTPPERYLLLTNGQIIKGVVSEDQKNFLVRQRIGVMPFAKKRVVGTFNTIREAYDYQVRQLPNGDCEERMKLAQWCLNMKLVGEAREQLKKVIELNSKHYQARAMLFTMEQAAAVVAQRKRDPEVRQTGAEAAVGNQPGALDSAVIEKAQRGLNVMGMPVIFDLPTPLAIKRTHEFIRFVNPLLQAYCVKCHDGNYDGEFQLVPTRNRSEQTQDALRVNLDATLRLIDPENLAKSELLTTTLRPHGEGARKRPIFQGSNDRAYQILATWAQSLRSPKNAREPVRAQPGRPEPEDGETFAAGRGRTAKEGSDDGLPALSGGGRPPLAGTYTPPSAGIPPRAPFVPPSGGIRPDGSRQEAADDFPLPFAITGKKPNLGSSDRKEGGRRTEDGRRRTEDGGRRTEDGSSSVAAGKTAEAPTANPSGNGLMKGASADAGKTRDPAKTGAPKGTAKKFEIDPGLLERAILNRNGAR